MNDAICVSFTFNILHIESACFAQFSKYFILLKSFLCIIIYCIFLYLFNHDKYCQALFNSVSMQKFKFVSIIKGENTYINKQKIKQLKNTKNDYIFNIGSLWLAIIKSVNFDWSILFNVFESPPNDRKCWAHLFFYGWFL